MLEEPVCHAALEEGEPEERGEPTADHELRPLPRGPKDGLCEEVKEAARHGHVLFTSDVMRCDVMCCGKLLSADLADWTQLVCSLDAIHSDRRVRQ